MSQVWLFRGVVQLICRPTTTEHHNKQVENQGFRLAQDISYARNPFLLLGAPCLEYREPGAPQHQHIITRHIFILIGYNSSRQFIS